MTAQHTPGPWGVQDDHGRRYVETLQGNDDTICEVHKRDKKGEYAANAHLIATAPEMLDLLKAGRRKLATYQSVYTGDKELRRLLTEWDAAITKATGSAA